MESTQMKIGGSIASLRKARGLTQEQLAQQLGVSAPAVSKWETDSSYPDITLLCPLARALGTNVDTLLRFHPTLSDEEATEQLNGVLDLAMKQNLAGARERLEDLLRQYPGCAALQYMAATAYDAFQMFFPTWTRLSATAGEPPNGHCWNSCVPQGIPPTGRAPPCSWPRWP